MSCSQVVAVLKAVLPDGRDVRFRSDLVGGRGARLLLVRHGRHKLTPRRVRVLHILLEAFGAQLAPGSSARAGSQAVRPSFRRPRAAPVPELLVVVPAQQLWHRRQHQHADAQQRHGVCADGQRIAAVAVRQLGVVRGVGGKEELVGATVMTRPVDLPRCIERTRRHDTIGGRARCLSQNVYGACR